MKQRGRKQTLAVVNEAPISAHERPEPTPELTPEQRLVWISVVNSLPADWIRSESLPQYCRHVVASNHVAQMLETVEGTDEIDVEDYDRLLRMQERESRITVSLATKLRLTPQSEYRADKVRNTKKAKAPWAND
jgi:hypothetical protein